MADQITIIPPAVGDEEALDVFHNQVCEALNDIDNRPLVTTPDTPTDVTTLSAEGGYGLNIISFDAATYTGHRYTEIVRSLDTNVNNAVFVGTTTGELFYDGLASPDATATYTYWAKHVNTDGTESTNWSSSASCTLITEVDYALAVLQGKVGIDEMKTDNFPVRKVTVLPSLPDGDYPEGCLVYLTTSSKIYRNASEEWAAEMSLSNVEGDIVTVERPVGGSYSYTGGVAGAIKITLPQSWTNTMMKFKVDVYNYITDASFTLALGGYNYTGAPSWYNTSAQLYGNKDYNNRVRFGHDGSKCCILIGDTTADGGATSWSYPKIKVKDFQGGHYHNTISDWETDWSVTITDDISGVTVNRDISDALLDAKSISNQGNFATLDKVTPSNVSTYVDSLSVDTTQIANQAVTLPASAFTAGEYLNWDYSPANTWRDLQTLTVTSTGATAVIMATVEIEKRVGGTLYYEVRIIRDSTVLYSVNSTRGIWTQALYSSVTTVTVQDIPPAGSHTYKYQVRRAVASYNECSAHNRGLVYLEMKK